MHSNLAFCTSIIQKSCSDIDQLTKRINKLFRILWCTKFIFFFSILSYNICQSIIICSWHPDINIIIPRNKSLMSDRTEQCSIYDKIFKSIFTTDFIKINEHIQCDMLHLFNISNCSHAIFRLIMN